jgi:membrane-bound lytic murein transglycosylase D
MKSNIRKLFLSSICLLCLILSTFAQQPRLYSRVEPLKLEITENKYITQYLHYYQGRGRQSMETAITNYGLHEITIKKIFREEGIPDDLGFIYQVQAIWDGRLTNWNTHKGLWTFDRKTAKRFGLRINKYIDERKSFEKATRATARYLRFLWEKYDKNWELALGAYFIREQKIDKAIKRGKSKDYWKLFPVFPKEQRNFVPNTLAAILILNNKELYNFESTIPVPFLEYSLVRLKPRTSLEIIAQLASTSPENIRRLNPELIAKTTPPEPYIVRLPAESLEIFMKRIRRYYDNEKAKKIVSIKTTFNRIPTK